MAMHGLESSPADWRIYRDSMLQKFKWNLNGVRHELRPTPEGNLWQVIACPTNEVEYAAGYVAVYVDDLLAVGPDDVVRSVLKRIMDEWKCLEPEFVQEGRWMKYCGFELSWDNAKSELIIGQEAYTLDLLSRHEPVAHKATPLPGTLCDEPEEKPTAEQIKAAQGLVGELLWLSTRTRPDLSFAVAWLGRGVGKYPARVCEYGKHVLGYVTNTSNVCLRYGKCSPALEEGSDLAFKSTMTKLEIFCDASFAPPGGRGQQGVIVRYGGAPVQWESKLQPFATISSSEAEICGYLDGVVMGESTSVIVNILEQGMLDDELGVLYGDSQTGLKILQAPDGAWRTRHLRLRCFTIRERVNMGLWKVRHLAGAKLAADLLTKPVTQLGAWQAFMLFMNLRAAGSSGGAAVQSGCACGGGSRLSCLETT